MLAVMGHRSEAVSPSPMAHPAVDDSRLTTGDR